MALLSRRDPGSVRDRRAALQERLMAATVELLGEGNSYAVFLPLRLPNKDIVPHIGFRACKKRPIFRVADDTPGTRERHIRD